MSPLSLDREIHRFQEYLQDHGLKLTNERSALVREIFSAHYHFEADELLLRLKQKNTKISRATIYRTLELLVKCGMVRRVHLGEDHYHYERITDNARDHHHLVCTACGGVVEFHDDAIEERQQEICRRNRFLPTFKNLQILGICHPCRKKGEEPDSPDRVKMIQITNNSLRK